MAGPFIRCRTTALESPRNIKRRPSRFSTVWIPRAARERDWDWLLPSEFSNARTGKFGSNPNPTEAALFLFRCPQNSYMRHGAKMTKEVTILIAEDDAGHARLIEKNLFRADLHNPMRRFENGQQVIDFFFG